MSLSLLALVWRRKIFALAIMCLCMGAGLAFFRSAPREYEASSLLIINPSPDILNSGNRLADTPDRLLAIAQITDTDDVLDRAIQRVGIEKFLSPKKPPVDRYGLFLALAKQTVGEVRVFFEGAQDETSIGKTIHSVRRNLTVKPDEKANLLRISYRDTSPELSVALVNAIDQVLIDKQLEIWGQGGRGAFFQSQKNKFDDERREAAAALKKFSLRTGIYSVEEQRKLLLKKYSDIVAALEATQDQKALKTGQMQVMTVQLRQLRPVTRSSFVTGLVEQFGAKFSESEDRPQLDQKAGETSRIVMVKADKSPLMDLKTSETPPLLMVKVYQDFIVDLFKVGAELNGYANLALRQQTQVHEAEKELQELAETGAQFESLQSALTLAAFNSENYAKRMAEEGVNQDIIKSRMSTIKVAQGATKPVVPVWPSLAVILAASAIFGMLLSLVFVALIEMGTIWRSINAAFAAPKPDLRAEVAAE